MLGNSVVYVERFGDAINVVGFSSEKVDDTTSIGASAGPGQDVPEQTLPRVLGSGMRSLHSANT